jgi:spore coat protein A, manganese oxidase
MTVQGDGRAAIGTRWKSIVREALIMTMLTRRQLLKASAMAGAGLLLPWKGTVRSAYAFAQSDALKKFAQQLRGNTALSLLNEIGVAAPDGTRTWGSVVANHYTIEIDQFQDQLQPTLPPPAPPAPVTKLWGFKPTTYLLNTSPPGAAGRHLGGIIVAQKGTPVQITFKNKLPTPHLIPVDTTIPGANQAQNRTAVHIHGGFVPWISDGGPFDWWAPDGTHGESFLNNEVLRPDEFVGGTIPADEAEYYYPNDQSARLLWYHDHAWGITRINAYAGIATGYIIRDAFEASLVGPSGLPDFIENGGREMPIVIQDKIFVGSTTALTDPLWFTAGAQGTALGDLWYAHVYEPKLYSLFKGKKALTPPAVSVVPEFFGDTMLANGTVYPFATVEARRYRLRILNACNARFLNLQLYVDDGSPDGITLNKNTGLPTNLAGPSFTVIGTEGGFLPNAVVVPSNVPFSPVTLQGSLVTGPAERWDVIIDFKGFEGKKLILYNDAPAPFPVGAPTNDYFPGAPQNPTVTTPGFGPNTRQIMRFDVGPLVTPAEPALDLALFQDVDTELGPDNDPAIDELLVNQTPDVPVPFTPNAAGTAASIALANPAGPAIVPIRNLTLNEAFDGFGRLIQLEGTNIPLVAGGGFGRAYTDSATEVVNKDNIEIWAIANLTGDTHPIHFHLVNAQILARQPVKVNQFAGTVVPLGLPSGPVAYEVGWKETVKMNPGEVTYVIMQFKLPTVPFDVPSTPRTAASPNQPGLGITLAPGQKAHEYVWHCHILEHEEHDMMRPLVVVE